MCLLKKADSLTRRNVAKRIIIRINIHISDMCPVCVGYTYAQAKFLHVFRLCIMHLDVPQHVPFAYTRSSARISILNVHICASPYMCTYYSGTVKSAGQQRVSADLCYNIFDGFLVRLDVARLCRSASFKRTICKSLKVLAWSWNQLKLTQSSALSSNNFEIFFF